LLKAEFYVNGVFAGNSFSAPFSFSFTPDDISNISDSNELKVVLYDSVLNRGESSITFNIQE
jgi:hypothetical protein